MRGRMERILREERDRRRVKHLGLLLASKPCPQAHPTDSVLKEPVEDVLASEDRVSANTTQEVFKESLSSGDRSDILLRLRLALDSIIGDALLGRNRRNNQDRVQALQCLVQRQE